MTTMTVDYCTSNISLAKDNISNWMRDTIQYYRYNCNVIPNRLQELSVISNTLLMNIKKLHNFTNKDIIEEITKYSDLIDRTKDTNYLVVYKEYMYALQMELQRRSLQEEEAV